MLVHKAYKYRIYPNKTQRELLSKTCGCVRFVWNYENGNWYFFDADGWMVTNNYASWGGKDYYFGADGTLQTTGKAPDGRKVEANGALEGASKYGVQTDEDSMFNQGPGMKL